ncbi:MAG: hypothetical protein ACFE0Q_13505 [Anaerolineae bacterium]
MTTLISTILTLVIFSYLLSDTPLFRVAVAMFVGLAAAFTSIVTFQSVILPLTNSTGTNAALLLFSGILTLLLLLKPLRSVRILTNLSLGFLIAIGTVIAIIGAIGGTLIPIISQTAEIETQAGAFQLVSDIILVIGVITSLLYFNYSARRTPQGTVERGAVMGRITQIGQGFIVITLGALYGAAILTSLTILTGQLEMLFGG